MNVYPSIIGSVPARSVIVLSINVAFAETSKVEILLNHDDIRL